MSNENQKHENTHENEQPTAQPIAPATPLELSDEELGQVSGGGLISHQPAPTSVGGLPAVTSN